MDAREMIFGSELPKAMETVMGKHELIEDFIEALQEISEAKGAFKKDPHEHAKSCIRDMQATAIDVLKKHGVKPRGQPVDER